MPAGSGLYSMTQEVVMVRIDPNSKSVRYHKEVDDRLSLLARKLGRTKRELVIQMVDYFYKSKKDPADLNDEMLKKELSSGISRILSFIRKQEGDLLVPIYSMASELSTLAKLQGKVTKAIAEAQLKGNAAVGESVNHLKILDSDLKRLIVALAEKDKLKSGFRKILEHYIAQRETLGWPVSAAKKEELAKQVRQALENL
ncbi:BfmA/BtgA family mobilization protein [Sphingobacterium kyonggiense]